MSMWPCTMRGEMLMDWLVTTMLLLQRTRIKAKFIVIRNLKKSLDHLLHFKYPHLSHHLHMEKMTLTPLMRVLICCLTSAVNQMYQCTTYPLQTNAFYSLWNYLFDDMDKQQVTKVPYNINGNHCYTIEVHSGKWHKAQEDGRWFLMHTSTVRRSNMVHKSGKCIGSFICKNDNCPKFTSGKGHNTYAFTNIGFNLYECKTCGNVADRQFCGAMKLTMFYPDRNQLQVYYAGTHTCSLKMRSAYTVMPEKVKKAVLKPIL